MPLSRRALIQGLIGASAGLVLPTTLAENIEATRRYWALGAMPGTGIIDVWEQDWIDETGSYDALMRDFRKITRAHMTRQAELIYRAMSIVIDRRADTGLVAISVEPDYTVSLTGEYV